MQSSRKRTLAMIVIAGLLIPTGYGMFTSNFLLAGIGVCGIVAARVLGISSGDSDESM